MVSVTEIVDRLQAVGAVSGAEDAAAALLAGLARPHADEVTVDRLGNVVIHKKGDGPRVMLCAHMDTVGLLATHVEDGGFVRFAAVGGLSPRELAGAEVVFTNGARGIVRFEEKTDPKDWRLTHGYIDLGADGRGTGDPPVRTGDRARFAGRPFVTNGKLVSPHLDNMAGCAVLLRALARLEQVENDLYFVFTVQEELGLRGARTAAFAIEPDWALAVDVADAYDVPEPKRVNECRLGGGPAVKLMDASVVCHPAVVRHLEDCARSAGLSVQYEVTGEGGTDAGAVCLSRGGVPAGGVSVPARYIHTPFEMASLSDIEDCAALVALAAARRMTE